MNKVMANGKLHEEPRFSIMQNGSGVTAICKGTLLSNQANNDNFQGDLFPLICFDDVAYYMKEKCKKEDEVVLYGFLANNRYKTSKDNLQTQVIVVTELIDMTGKTIKNKGDIEEKVCQEMSEHGFSLETDLKKYFN